MELVERHAQLAELEAALQDAGAGQGAVVLVTGEAGAGKTALVRRLASVVAPGGRVIWGLCDELATPRPLGPFRDMLSQLGGELTEVVGHVMLDAVVAELGRGPRPPLVLVEDVHWADEATLDAIRFLGRRVRRLGALLVMTYRDDEVPADHPLRIAISAVPPDDILRITLPPLSRQGVARLAGRDDVDELYRITGGNPFYVTEVLAAPGDVVPHTVQDVVMARIRRLSDGGRACLDTVAVVPGLAEQWLLKACGVTESIDEATRLGILQLDGEMVCFSHELTRRAVEQNLTTPRRQEINGRVLEVLIARDADPARLAHHAAQANDTDAVARFAPVAARRAASLDSHREAVAHFRQALDHPETYSQSTLAALWYEYARECSLTERHDSADRALRHAIEIHTELGDQSELGVDLFRLSEVQWFLGRGREAGEAITRAIAVLEQLPASTALAWAYAEHARLAMVNQRNDEAVEWGERAIALARQRGDTEVLVHALNTVGSAQWMGPPFDHRALLESLELARANSLNAQVPRAYSNLVDGYLQHMNYTQAGRCLQEGLEFCEAHDLLTAFNRLQAHRAAWHLEQGRWADAEDDARATLAAGDVTRVVAQTVLGLLLARRGNDAAEVTLDEAQRLADRVGEPQHLILVGLGRLELAWLQGGLEAAAPLASAMLELAGPTRSPSWMGEAALWLHRAGHLKNVPPAVLEPYALQISGHWRKAAAAWAELGRPYAQADAQADAPEPEPLFEALEVLDQLGAKPRAAMVRRRLAELGVASVPRGPDRSTRESPAGLTTRQTEVLRLLAQNLTYKQIATLMHLSVKTVDHHAVALRAKLDATTSAEAVTVGRRLGILDSKDS